LLYRGKRHGTNLLGDCVDLKRQYGRSREEISSAYLDSNPGSSGP
jgi:hypothetical protein